MHNIPDDVWTPDLVGKTLVEAVRWATMSGGPVGPTSGGSILVKLMTSVGELKEPKSKRPKYSPRRVSQLERALYWPATYLKEDRDAALVLSIWLRSKISRFAFQHIVEEIGLSRATAYRSIDIALTRIAMGLTRDGISPKAL